MSEFHITGQIGTLHAGDRVLVVLAKHVAPDQLQEIKDGLQERFPDVEFTLLAGSELVVKQPTGGAS